MGVGLIGLGLTVLGMILAWMWRTNRKMQLQIISALERIEEGQQRGFKTLSEMLNNQTKILNDHTRLLGEILKK